MSGYGPWIAHELAKDRVREHVDEAARRRLAPRRRAWRLMMAGLLHALASVLERGQRQASSHEVTRATPW